jgi:hypothetical protein
MQCSAVQCSAQGDMYSVQELEGARRAPEGSSLLVQSAKWPSAHGVMVRSAYGAMVPSHLKWPWCTVAMVHSGHGAQWPWFQVAIVPWCQVAKVPSGHGTMVPSGHGAKWPWCQVDMVPSGHGTMVPSGHGAMVPWCQVARFGPGRGAGPNWVVPAVSHVVSPSTSEVSASSAPCHGAHWESVSAMAWHSPAMAWP